MGAVGGDSLQYRRRKPPNDSNCVLNYCGDEAYDVLNIRTEDLRPVLQHMARDGKVRDTEGELPAGIGGHFAFALGGDKPWLLTVIGRRNMNHTYFSPWCKCSRENITCLSCEGGQDGHYSVDQDQMCRDSHVCPNMCLRGGEFVPFTCGCCGKVFACVEDIEAEEDSMLSLEPDVFKARGKVFSLNHDGRFWNAPPLLPFKWVWPDPLHLFLNLSSIPFGTNVSGEMPKSGVSGTIFQIVVTFRIRPVMSASF